MANINKYIIFLNNRYSRKDIPFYKNLLRGKSAIAADGGIRFFLRNKIKPDILIGDFDSAPHMSNKYLTGIEIIAHPVRKNKTDSHLAVELALERGAEQITIVGAFSTSEIDHTLSNIFLLKLIHNYAKKKRRKIASFILSPKHKIQLLENETKIIEGKKGAYFSAIQLKDNTEIFYEGMSYPPPQGKLKIGDSYPLRNKLLKKSNGIRVKGSALIIISSNAKI